MKNFRIPIVTGCGLLALVSVTGVARAQGEKPRFEEKVVQVLKADRSNAYAMFHAIPVNQIKRDLTTDAQELTWREREPRVRCRLSGPGSFRIRRLVISSSIRSSQRRKCERRRLTGRETL